MTTPQIKNRAKKEDLQNALAACIGGDIYKLKTLVKAGFDPSTQEHICLTEAARLGNNHIVGYILKVKCPPENILKRVTNICADNFKHETLLKIIRDAGIYSSKTIQCAEYAGNHATVDYLTERELFKKIGEFYNEYKHLPERITKLLGYQERKYIEGEPAPIGFGNAHLEVIQTLKGIIYKTELQTMLQICCREGLKDSADILFLATKMQKHMGIGFESRANTAMFKDEGRNSTLTYTVSFGTFEDYTILKKEAKFLGNQVQKNNLGYTINLAIKNKNIEIALDLIKSGYCPEPKLPSSSIRKLPQIPQTLNKDQWMFDSVINNITNLEEEEDGAKLLSAILKQQHRENELPISQCLNLPELRKGTWNYTLKAIKTGREEIAQTFLKIIDIKELRKQKYHNTILEGYVQNWVENFRKVEMINSRKTKSLEIW